MRFILQFIWAGLGYLCADMDFMEVHSYEWGKYFWLRLQKMLETKVQEL